MNFITLQFWKIIWERGKIPLIVTLFVILLTIVLTIVFIKKEINIKREDDKK